jgi:L-aspartate oxidase
VFLDATSLGERFYDRFPTITAACREIGIDPARDRIPVAPAAHFACGGVPARLDGTTALAGLYAVGEVACTGVHGANRLASNSLTEGVVAGTRLGRDLAWELPERVEPTLDATPGAVLDGTHRVAVRQAMSRYVGVLRDNASLDAAAAVLGDLAGKVDGGRPSRASWEATNVLTVASAVVAAAAARTESRGCHRRGDFPEPSAEWRRHLAVQLGADGGTEVSG